MKQPGLEIIGLDESCAEKGRGICVGDRIVRVNGQPVADELDYRFYSAEDWVEIDIRRPQETECLRFRLKHEEAGGFSFAPMQSMRCRNHCLFCFVHQLPTGLRRSLYVKDEDYRFSFLYGNYVTLASAKDEELDRICRLRLDPIYISVHATDPDIRNQLLGRKGSVDILKTMERLAGAGITMHTQIVLCPGINDEEVLEKTIFDLAQLYPSVASIAIVPVGLTRHRKMRELFPLQGVTKKTAIKIIRNISRLQQIFKVKYDEYFLFLSDEFYWKAELPFPAYYEYSDFPQWENGVGMIALFNRRWEKRRRRKVGWRINSKNNFIVITGELTYQYLMPYIKWLEAEVKASLKLIPIKNHFFGRQVNVTGLITGQDIIKQLKPCSMSDTILLVPEVMLNEGRFLDDVLLESLGDTLGVSVKTFPADSAGFETTLKQCAKG